MERKAIEAERATKFKQCEYLRRLGEEFEGYDQRNAQQGLF